MQTFRYFLIYLITGLLFTCPPTAAEDRYLSELISRAGELRLSRDPVWLSLLHYKKSLFKDISLVRPDSKFFNSPAGYKDPEDELRATLAAFFKDELIESGGRRQLYQCAFKARYEWLKRKLQFDPGKLPEKRCELFKEWFQAINPAGVTLIFPSTYINNPASAFGHTLLRIDQPGQTERTRLIAYTVNYEAKTGGENALLYGVKGIFGGFKGYFSVAPYYEKVTKYSDIEKRDIWEYELNLTKDETDFLVMHAWELLDVPLSYYYFDENCSYHLLGLLDAARPESRLLNDSGIWVLPVDTVKAIEERGLIKKVEFRPSLLTKLTQRLDKAGIKKQKLAKKVIEQDETPPEFSALSPANQAEVLDLGYEFLSYKIVGGGKFEFQKDAYQLLRARSTLPKGEPFLVAPPEESPEKGHDTARIALGSGRENGRWLYDINYRGVYHDLMDPGAGFYKGSQIEMGDISLRGVESSGLRLRRADIMDVISLSPRNALLKPYSWRAKAGFETQRFKDNTDHLYFGGEAGAGFSWELSERAMAYSLANVSFRAARQYSGDLTAGVLPEAGIYVDISKRLRLNFFGEYGVFVLGDDFKYSEYGTKLRFTLAKDLAMKFSYKHERSFDYNDNELLFSLEHFL